MKKAFLFVNLLTSLLLTGCTAIMENIPGVYSLDVQQGNIITQNEINQLRPKMTQRQVRYIMGSPMLIDIFHQKRWDYIYSEQPGGGARMQKRVSLFFDGDQLIGVQGDLRPTTFSTPRVSKETTIDIPKRELDKTLSEKLGSIFTAEDEPVVATEEPTEDPQKGTKTDAALEHVQPKASPDHKVLKPTDETGVEITPLGEESQPEFSPQREPLEPDTPSIIEVEEADLNSE